MLKLNKEYTYREICNELGWKVFTGGDSKKAQLKEIESAYRFFHPENKKIILKTVYEQSGHPLFGITLF